MKAITYSEYGPPDVLNIEDVEKPVPGGDEILIKVRASEATKSDCEMRSFSFAVSWFWLPMRLAFGVLKPRRKILGMYFSGTIEAVGQKVSRFTPGEDVIGCTQLKLGAYAEYLCLPADYTIVKKPANISFEQAAAIPLGGLNALHFLRKADIQPGDKVLVNGAGASIGTFGVQIARAMGAEVTAVDSDIKESMLRSIGAKHFIDYRHQQFTDGGEQYDVIFSMVANTAYSACIRTLAPGGRYLLANPRLIDMLRSWLTGLFSDKRVFFAFAKETEEELQSLARMVQQGSIQPVIDKIYTMEQAAAAHTRVETEQRSGCVVIRLDED